MTGRVVESVDRNQAVRRAIVTIVGSRLPAGRSAITDDDGRFVFDRIPSGSVTLSATRAGYLRAVFGATRSGRPGTPIALTDGADLRDVTIEMTHGSAVDGVVRDVAGDPAPGLRVEAIRISHHADGDRGETGGSALTDDRGEYRIYGLLAGDYVLVATPAAIISGIGDIGMPTESEVDAILASLPRRAPASNPPGTPGTPGQRPPAAESAPPAAKGYSTPPTYYPGVSQSAEATRVTLGPTTRARDWTSRCVSAILPTSTASSYRCEVRRCRNFKWRFMAAGRNCRCSAAWAAGRN